MKDSTVNGLLVFGAATMIAVILGIVLRAMIMREEMSDRFKRACMPGMLLDHQMNPMTSEQEDSDGIFIGQSSVPRSYMLLCTDGKEKWVKTVEGEIK